MQRVAEIIGQACVGYLCVAAANKAICCNGRVFYFCVLGSKDHDFDSPLILFSHIYSQTIT